MSRWIVLPVFLISACTAPKAAKAADLSCGQLPIVIGGLAAKHYKVREVTDEVKQRAAHQFVLALDPSRTLLLKAEVPELEKKVATVFESMRSGSCASLEAGYNLVLERSREDERWAKEILSPKFKLDETVELHTDPEKRGYAATTEARKSLVEKMIHFQLANLQVAGISLDKGKEQVLKRYARAVKRLEERKEKGKLATLFAEVYATALDPHSSFLSADALAEFNIHMRLSLEGIGAALRSIDGVTTIESLVPGGQAEKTGKLRPKDKVMAVAQDGEDAVSTLDMDLSDVVKMIRGKKGTKVTLSVMREAETTTTFDVTIVRDKIDVKEQAAKLSYEERSVKGRKLKLGVIDLPSFYGGGEAGEGRSSYTDVKNLVNEATKNKVDGLVIDVSRNGGGLLSDAVKIAGLFIREGAVVSTRDTSGRIEVLEDEDDALQFKGPVVVLTSAMSASASEILAGALQDYRRAVIVGGQNTFGKGTVQVILPLPGEYGAMKVTTGMFFLPAGASTQQRGVVSDIHVPSVFDSIDVGEKTLDYALPPDTTTAFLSKEANSAKDGWKPVDPASLGKLAEASKARVAKDLEKLNAKLAEIQKNRGTVRVADLLKDKGKKAEEDPEDDHDDKQLLQEAVNILADLVTLS